MERAQDSAPRLPCETKLLDVRAYEKGPFLTFPSDPNGAKSFSCIKFSNDGKLMLQVRGSDSNQRRLSLLSSRVLSRGRAVAHGS